MHNVDTAKPEPAYQEFLNRPIRELGLTLAGSPVERFVEQLYRELNAKGLTKFRPACYLTDEWGCPSGEPIIGIPFYLAHAALAQLEKETHDLEDAREIMMYLRHEAGHAFTYAYKLHNTPDWKKTFGPFRRPYRDNYRPAPFCRDLRRLADAALELAQALSRLGSSGEAALSEPAGTEVGKNRSSAAAGAE